MFSFVDYDTGLLENNNRPLQCFVYVFLYNYMFCDYFLLKSQQINELKLSYIFVNYPKCCIWLWCVFVLLIFETDESCRLQIKLFLEGKRGKHALVTSVSRDGAAGNMIRLLSQNGVRDPSVRSGLA